MTAAPYPQPDTLSSAAAHDLMIECHQCSGDPRRRTDCPACLGIGLLRPCARCFVASQSKASDSSPCLVCGGLGYTAGQPMDRESAFYRRPWIVGRGLAAG